MAVKISTVHRNLAPEPGCSAPHNVDGENAVLMTCEQVIDEIANDRVGLVAKLGDHPADEYTGASVPFQIDHAMRFACAMNFGPTMWTPRPLVLCRYELKFPLELRIAHDLVAQRSASAGDYLDHCLHCALGSAGNQLFGNACLRLLL
jgi:hypothetical protein